MRKEVPPPFRRDRRSGVTLLELLVALALMALLASFGFSLIAASGRATLRSDRTEAAVEVLLAREALRSVLETAVAIPDATGATEGLAGSATRFSVRAILDDGTFWPGTPVDIALGRTEVSGMSQVELAIAGLAENDQAPIERQSPLSGPDGQMELAYFGSVKVGERPVWQDDWPPDAPLPLLVRIAIRDGERDYPPLILRPGKQFLQSEMSLSSLVPPATPSRP